MLDHNQRDLPFRRDARYRFANQRRAVWIEQRRRFVEQQQPGDSASTRQCEPLPLTA